MKRQLSFIRWIPVVGCLIFCVWPRLLRSWPEEFLWYQFTWLMLLLILDAVYLVMAWQWHVQGIG